MTKPLTTKQIARTDALLATLKEPVDTSFPTLSQRDAVLCARRLLNLSPAEAAQLVAAHRGQAFDDTIVVDGAGVSQIQSSKIQTEAQALANFPYKNDPHFLAFCDAVAECLLELLRTENPSPSKAIN
jgi:hypothetical protein